MMGLYSPSKYLKLMTSMNQKNFSILSRGAQVESLALLNSSPSIYRDQFKRDNKRIVLTMRKYSTQGMNDTSDEKVVDGNDPMKKPSLEQLLNVDEKMKAHLPRFLKETHIYYLYTTDVIFENLYFDPPKTTKGTLSYAIALTKLKWKIGVKFSNASIQILKVTNDEEDGTVKIRWRLRGLRGMKIFTPWKLKVWNLAESIKNESEWHDGFSILYVRGDGRIYKHTMQRVIENKDETAVDKKAEKLNNILKKNVNIGTTM